MKNKFTSTTNTIFKRLFFLHLIFIIDTTAASADNSVYHADRKPLSYSEAGRLAVSASNELKNEYRRQQLREGAWKWGLRAYFPQITFSVSEDDRLSQMGNDSFIKNYSIGAEQLVWDGGRLNLYRKLEKAELNLGSNSLDLASREVSENAITAYRQLVFFRMLYNIRNNALQSLEEQRLILQKEYELGLALPIDIASADITVTGAKIDLLSLVLDLEETEKRFTEILGLDELPPLLEIFDDNDFFNNKIQELPNPATAREMAETRNMELRAARLSVLKSQAEAKTASLSWIPTIKLNGSFGLKGNNYPLTKYNWSLGVTLEFSSPWMSGRLNGLAGMDPPYEKNARTQMSLNPFQNPADSFTAKNAMLVYELEKTNYLLAFNRAGRLAEQGIEKCSLMKQKHTLALEALKLEGEKYRLSEIMLELGKLTRIQLMEARMEYASSEASALEAFMALLESERELEKFLNLEPGELSLLRSPHE